MSASSFTADRKSIESALRQLDRSRQVFVSHMLMSVGCWLVALVAFLNSISNRLDAASLTLSPGSVVLGALSLPHDYTDALQSVAGLQDVRAVGPLLDMLPGASPRHRTILHLALIALLPKMRRDDAILLTNSHHEALIASMLLADAYRDAEFMIAVLRMLTEFGDRRALHLVREVARLNHAGSVHNEARECLKVLTERIERNKVGETLLRASDASKIPADLLLPVSDSFSTVAGQLIRPIE